MWVQIEDKVSEWREKNPLIWCTSETLKSKIPYYVLLCLKSQPTFNAFRASISIIRESFELPYRNMFNGFDSFYLFVSSMACTNLSDWFRLSAASNLTPNTLSVRSQNKHFDTNILLTIKIGDWLLSQWNCNRLRHFVRKICNNTWLEFYAGEFICADSPNFTTNCGLYCPFDGLQGSCSE